MTIFTWNIYQEMRACLVVQLCLTLCDPMDYSPPGSSVPGILQARMLEWAATPFSGAPRNLPDPGIEPRSPALQADSLPSEPSGKSLPRDNLFQKLGRIHM